MAALTVMAQKPCPVWSVDFKTIFDNREGDAVYNEAQTFFMTQLAPEIGLSIDNGRHTVTGGVVWTQPIGCEWDGQRYPLPYTTATGMVEWKDGWECSDAINLRVVYRIISGTTRHIMYSAT